MFGKITDLSGTRNIMDAISFYVFFTVLLVGLSSTIVHILGMVGIVGEVGNFFVGGGLHTLIGSAWVLFVSSMVVTSKGLSKDLLSIVLVLLGTYLAHDMGVLIGMVPVAILTMLKKV